ncbi:MAG: glycosyltransferase family 4 protein [Clostridia bacterium]|nr:glycosyltransferase family 4 protein [Clostridia bacterium]MBO7319949.1 glycosyltransferase family 4 protein [Clostridia bacterium]
MKKALMVSHVAYAIDMFNIPNIRLLISMGYEVQVACNFDDRSSLSDEKVALLKEKLTALGVKYHNIPFERQPLKPANLKAYTQLKKLIDGEKFELIHCHTPVGGIITRLAAAASRRKNGTRVIYTAHGFHFFKGAPLINWLIYFTAEKLCSYFTDTLITINKEDFSNAQHKLNSKKVCYVPGVGVDTDFFSGTRGKREALLKEISADENSIILLSIGELSDRKNHSVSIKALSQMKNDNVHLVIAGTGEKREEFLSLAKELGVDGRVHLLGFRTDVAELLKSADIFLFPSIQEGLPVALMEAMSCGLPVICSEIRGNTDLIDDSCGVLCPATDAFAFKSAVEKLTEDDALRSAMAQKALQESKKYDIKIIENYMKDIYSGE